jgi:hypothetical protein
MPVAFFECKILQCCQVFEFIVGNLMILKKNHWIFLIKRIKNYQMFIYGPSKKPEICNYVKNICIIFLWEPNWANFTYGWWSPWWHYEIEIKLACTRCVRCRCIMHRCVISIMFDSCFWFLKKTFLFKQPLVPRCPGPSHFPPPPRAGVSYIWGSYILGMDDGAESGVASFLIPKTVQNRIKGCFIFHPQKFSYID